MLPYVTRVQARTSENPIPSNLDVYFENACACVCLVDLHPFSPRREKRRHLRQFSTDLAGRLLDYERARHCLMRVTKCGEYSFLLNQRRRRCGIWHADDKRKD